MCLQVIKLNVWVHEIRHHHVQAPLTYMLSPSIISDLTQPTMNKMGPDHNTGNSMPYSSVHGECVGYFNKGPHSTDRLFDRLCFCYGNWHSLSQPSDWMNFSFGGIFIFENYSMARNACQLKLGL